MKTIKFKVVANFGLVDNLIWEFEDLEEAKKKVEQIKLDNDWGMVTSVKMYKVETIITECEEV